MFMRTEQSDSSPLLMFRNKQLLVIFVYECIFVLVWCIQRRAVRVSSAGGVHTGHPGNAVEVILLFCCYCLFVLIGNGSELKVKVVQIPQMLVQRFCFPSSVPKNVHLCVKLIQPGKNGKLLMSPL